MFRQFSLSRRCLIDLRCPFLLLLCSTTFAESVTVETAKETLVAKLSLMQSIVARFTLDEVPHCPQEVLDAIERKSPGTQGLVLHGPRSIQCDWRYRDGNMLYTRTMSKDWLAKQPKGEVSQETITIAGGRSEHLYYTGESAEAQGIISAPIDLLNEIVVDIGLGFRGDEDKEFIQPQQFKAFDCRITKSGQVEFSRSGTGSYVHTWTFQPANGWALISYRKTQGGFRRFELINSQFQEASGLILPRKMEAKRFALVDGIHERLTEETSVTIESVEVNHPENTVQSFVLTWPKGSRILDNRSSKEFEVTSGDRVVTDTDLAELMRSTSP